MNRSNLDYVKERLFSELNKIYRISRSDFALIEQHLEFKRVLKKTLLAAESKQEENLLFICAGYVRQFYCTNTGKELNKAFDFENNILLNLHLETANGTRLHVEALEDTVFISLPMDILWKLCSSNLAWSNLVRILVQVEAHRVEDRETRLLLDNAETRYVNFVTANEQNIHRIPNYHIASYIGITQEALSRIKRRIVLTNDETADVQKYKEKSRYINSELTTLAST